MGFIGNYILATETERMPMASLGTSSDRIGTPKGPKAYYLTLAKSVAGNRATPYVSLNYSEHDRGLNFPFGVNASLATQWDAMFMYDGQRSHLLLTYKAAAYNVSLMWIWFRHPGISLSWGF